MAPTFMSSTIGVFFDCAAAFLEVAAITPLPGAVEPKKLRREDGVFMSIPFVYKIVFIMCDIYQNTVI